MTVQSPLLPVPSICPCPPGGSGHDERGLGGLIALAGRKQQPLPLAEVRVRTSIVGAVARTVVDQVFTNPLTTSVEAVHIFPLPEDGALTEVELRCGELVVRAECREREEAERTFAEARSAGHRAALVTRERPDVHTLRVTHLPPGETVTVRLVVIEALQVEDGLFRFRFPTVVAPRYMPGNAKGHDGPGTRADTDLVPDASRISPPLRLAGGTKLDLQVSFDGSPGKIQSSLHALRVDLDGGVTVAPSGSATLDRDFVLAFSWSGAAGGSRGWTDGKHTLVIVEPPALAAQSMPRDAVFCVDISGSMGGGKMEAAKQALRTALRGLVSGDQFRILAFDDRVEAQSPDLVPFSDAALAAAERWIDRLDARGGTEMLAPVVEALKGARPAGRLRTVLLITDGQAGNEAELIAAVANRTKGARFFTLGIDSAVNGSLLKQLAREGGGACTLCTPEDDIEAVMARIEARFGSPVADDLRANAGQAGAEEGRPVGRTLFAGQPVAIVVQGSGAVNATASSAAGPQTWTIQPERTETPLGAIWARERVAFLEDRLTLKPFEAEALRPEIVRVALEAGIASKFTAFVAVERSRKVDGTPVEVVQPVELPAGWEREELQAMSRQVLPMVQACMAPSYASPAPFPSGPAGAAPPADMDECAPDADDDTAFFSAPPPRAARSSVEAIRAVADSFRRAVAPRPAPQALAPAQKARKAPVDLGASLAQSQSADGSWGGDVLRTVANLLALLRLGHTRQSGLRKRAVQKAATWLAGHAATPVVAAALAALEAVERGEALVEGSEFRGLPAAG